MGVKIVPVGTTLAAKVTFPVNVVATLPNASSASTTTLEENVFPASTFVGSLTKARWVGAAAATVNSAEVAAATEESLSDAVRRYTPEVMGVRSLKVATPSMTGAETVPSRTGFDGPLTTV